MLGEALYIISTIFLILCWAILAGFLLEFVLVRGFKK